jgi:hypothetical protein
MMEAFVEFLNLKVNYSNLPLLIQSNAQFIEMICGLLDLPLDLF